MSPDETLTYWVRQLGEGNRAAAQPIWERFFHDMVRLAARKLRGAKRAAADEEDVALSAFDSFCQGVLAGRFPQLADRDGLWPLLVTITARKAVDLIQRENRQKRGGAATASGNVDGEAPRLEDIAGTEPTPEFAAQLAEEYERLLALLPDDGLRAVAQWKLENYTNGEIAEKAGCVRRSVERKLGLIRSIWQNEVPS